jgi:hypothetical protein
MTTRYFRTPCGAKRLKSLAGIFTCFSNFFNFHFDYKKMDIIVVSQFYCPKPNQQMNQNLTSFGWQYVPNCKRRLCLHFYNTSLIFLKLKNITPTNAGANVNGNCCLHTFTKSNNLNHL